MSAAAPIGGGWFAIGKADMEKILTSAGERDGATLFTVWAAVLNLCNRERSCDVSLPVGLIAHVAGLGYKSALRSLHTLSGLGMIAIEERRGVGKKNREPSLYHVKPSVEPCGVKTQGLGTKDRRVRSYNPPGETEISNTSSKEENKKTRVRAASASLTPECFFESAKEANAGRLSPTELEKFCSYWLEPDTKGRRRFQAEKFFDIGRRISTWASRLNVDKSVKIQANPANKPLDW